MIEPFHGYLDYENAPAAVLQSEAFPVMCCLLTSKALPVLLSVGGVAREGRPRGRRKHSWIGMCDDSVQSR